MNELTERERFLLTESKTFCIYPWIHLHAWSDGQAFPCCMFDCEQPIGDIKTNSINDTINSPLIKTIRNLVQIMAKTTGTMA